MAGDKYGCAADEFGADVYWGWGCKIVSWYFFEQFGGGREGGRVEDWDGMGGWGWEVGELRVSVVWEIEDL